jgi:hypothetical protein
VKNEGNEYPVFDPKRMMSISNELNEFCKEMLKEHLKKELTEIFIKVLKKNIQNQPKEYQDDK